jgi:enterochelin esterase-like enzyme
MQAQLPQVSAGTLQRFSDFKSIHVSARHIDVWLPPGYTPKKRYPVLYMHDGQMLFDSSINWNHQEWGVDETMNQLIRARRIRPAIVVGIWNTGAGRHADYLPQKPIESLADTVQERLYGASRSSGASVFNGQKVHSDQYLRFLVHELKPLIDRKFSTLRDRAHTFIAGSSMGGLISLYALCEYPQVFGGAACLSTHWPGIFTMELNPLPDAFLQYVSGNLPDPATHNIYMDYGDQTLDAMYPPLQLRANELIRKRGYTESNWITRYFPGEDHSERAWRRRLDLPLEFLLGTTQKK